MTKALKNSPQKITTSDFPVTVFGINSDLYKAEHRHVSSNFLNTILTEAAINGVL